MSDCIFCKIIKGEVPFTKVYEDEDTLAFLDINPITKGHTLVIPKEHAETIDKLSEDSLCKAVVIIKKILLDVIKNAKGSQVKITYLGAPKYRISVIGEDFKSVEKILKPVLPKIQESIEKKKGLFKFSREESIKTRVG